MVWQVIAGVGAAIGAIGARQAGKARASASLSLAQQERLRKENIREQTKRIIVDTTRDTIIANAENAASAMAAGVLSTTGTAKQVNEENLAELEITINRAEEDLALSEKGADLAIESHKRAAKAQRRAGNIAAISQLLTGVSAPFIK